jgi:hypothetical protein
LRRSFDDVRKRLNGPPEPVDESLPEWQRTYTPGYWDAYAAIRQVNKLFYRRRMQQIPALREWDWQREGAALLRDICGNPFRPVALVPSWLSWNGGMIPNLARAIHDGGQAAEGSQALDGDRLAILADALEDASCSDAELLGHLRSPGPHVCGCWAVDLLLQEA